MRLPTATSLRNVWRYWWHSFSQWHRASVWNRLLVLAVSLYGTVFSVLTSLRILALSAFAWDLGIYNQAMYTTVSGGGFFVLSGLPGSPPASLFGYHFSPILLLFLAPYAVFPSPVTLVVIQSWGIAFAAVPFYLLARRFLHSDRIAFIFAAVLLLSPATQGVNWFDFHPEAFLLLSFGFALYFLETRRWRAFLVATVVALSVQETVVILVMVVAVGALLAEWWSARTVGRMVDRPRTLALFSSVALAGLWGVLAFLVIGAANPGASISPSGFASWSVLGASNIPEVPLQAFLHPDRAITALATDAGLKAWYLIVLFAPVQLLTLRSPRSVLYCTPWLGIALLSNSPSFYLVGDQYPSFVLPFIFYGAIVGLAQPWSPLPLLQRIPGWPRGLRRSAPNPERYARVLVGVTVVLLVVVSPLGPWALGTAPAGRAPVIGAHEQAVLDLYRIVPSNASVLTQENLYPLFSGHLNIHFLPLNVLFPDGSSFNQTMDVWISTVDYVLGDFQTNFLEASMLATWPNVSARFSVVGAADGAFLLERGTHPLSLFRPIVWSFDYRGVVVLNATIAVDPAATSGTALLHANLTTSNFWYGPFVALPPGTYTVTYRTKVDRPSVGPLISLPVFLHPMNITAQVIHFPPYGQQAFFQLEQLPNLVTVSATEVQGGGVSAVGSYFTVSTHFTVTALGPYDFPGLQASGAVQLWFDELTIQQDTPSAFGTIPIVWS